MNDSIHQSLLASLISRRAFLANSGAASLFLVLSSQASTAATEGTINLGVMGPFTGPAAQTGEGIKRGTEMALEDARAAGEVPVKVDGKVFDVNIVLIDDESDPEKAVRALASAIERHNVRFIVTGWTTNVAIAAMKLEAQHKVVHLGYLSGSEAVHETINSDPAKYAGFFESYPIPASMSNLYGPPLQYFLEKGLWKPRSKKVALLVTENDYYRAWGEAVRKVFNSIGFETLPMDVVPYDATEFAPLLLKYKANDVSFIAFGSTTSVGNKNFLQQYKSSGNKALVIIEGLTWFSDWQALTGDTSEYVLSMDSPYAVTPEQKEWSQRFKEKYSSEPSITPSGYPYDFMRLAISVINKVGSMESSALIKGLEQSDYQGIWQHYKYSTEKGPGAPSQHAILVGPPGKGFSVPLAQIRGGKPEIVWPLEYATVEFEAPPGVNE